MGLLVGWEVEVFVGTCNSVCRMDARRPWPVTVVVDIVHGAVLYKTFFCQANVDSPSLAVSLSPRYTTCRDCRFHLPE
jgi:hypothetical protein